MANSWDYTFLSKWKTLLITLMLFSSPTVILNHFHLARRGLIKHTGALLGVIPWNRCNIIHVNIIHAYIMFGDSSMCCGLAPGASGGLQILYKHTVHSSPAEPRSGNSPSCTSPQHQPGSQLLHRLHWPQWWLNTLSVVCVEMLQRAWVSARWLTTTRPLCKGSRKYRVFHQLSREWSRLLAVT